MKLSSRFHRAARLSLIGGLVFLAGHGSPAPAAAVGLSAERSVPSGGAMAEAWSLAQQGQALADAGQSQAALLHVRRAHQLSSDPSLLLRAGQLEQELGNFARATRAFEQFLHLRSELAPKRERAMAQRLLELSSAGTARLNLQTNIQGAEIELEEQRGVASGAGFVARLVLDAGERRIALSKPGYETRTLTIELEPGEVKDLRVDLDKAVGDRSETKPGKPRLALLMATPPLGSSRAL